MSLAGLSDKLRIAMPEFKDRVLPYRTTGDELVDFVHKKAKGLKMDQIQAVFDSAHKYQGTLTAATELGLLNPEGEMTDAGKAFSLSTEQERGKYLLDALCEYEPYGLLLESLVLGRESADATSLDRIERWWSVNGYGKSANNRSEASTSLARFAEFAGLGTYKQGRRGKPSRIEWEPDATNRIEAVLSNKPLLEEDVPLERGSTPEDREKDAGSDGPPAFQDFAADVPVSDTSAARLDLGNGKTAILTLPSVLTKKEKKRLLALVDLLVEESEESPSNPSGPPDLFASL